MVRSAGRSAKTGRFVKRATVRRHPATTVTQTLGGSRTGGRNRSAKTGRFISKAAAARHPETSIREA
jgi:hypothetical protein